MSSRVANNLPAISYTNGLNQPPKSVLNRTGSNTSTSKIPAAAFHVRSAAPPPIQKETVHACPLCNNEYKDPRVLPCTHTYCFSCIRDKLINNSRITCPKCHYQAHPFDEIQLNELPPNLILSQEWRIGARPIVSVPTIKKPVTYQSNVSISIAQPTVPLTDMSQQQDKRKRPSQEQISTNGSHSHGVASIVNTYNQTFGGENDNRSANVSSTQPVVSNLIKIYSEASTSKAPRNDSMSSTSKHNELVKIFDQASNVKQPLRRISPPTRNEIQHRQVPEETYEEVTWSNPANGITPAAPPFPEQLQAGLENHRYPPESTEKPMAISSSRQNSNIGNLCHIISSIHHESPEKTSPMRQTSIPNSHSISRPSSASDDDENLIVHETINTVTPPRQHVRQISNADSVQSVRSDSTSRRSPVSPIKTNNQQKSNISPPYRYQQQQQQDDKVHHQASSTASSSNRSPASPIKIDNQQKTNLSPAYQHYQQQQQDDKISHRASSTAFSSNRSPASPIKTDNQQQTNLSPPYQHYQQQQDDKISHRASSIGSSSNQSPISPIKTNNQQKSNLSPPHQHYQQQQQQQDDKISHQTSSAASSSRRSSDRFPPPPPPAQNLEIFDPITNGSAPQRSASAISYRSSTHDDVRTPDAKLIRTERFSPDENNSPTNHRNNTSQNGSHFSTLTIERHRQQENSYSPVSSPSLVPNPVTSRVETLLSDQKRLEREIDEQIRRLKYDYDDVRKQIDRKESAIHNEVKHIAARLDDDITDHYQRKQKIYADLAVDTNTVGTELERLKSNAPNNKQQLWASLEQIESSIRNIRQAVEQHKEPHSALTFAEGRQTLAADTIGQITYKKIDVQSRYPSSPIPSQTEQPITNLTPYKYLKIDHLSTLEPEAIALTENNKKILLGICNKLFILNEYGDTLRTIQLTPSIRGIALAKKSARHHIAYVSHDETVSMIDIDSGQTLDCVKETDSSGESGTFLPLGIDTDQTYGNVYVCDYRNSCVIKFDEKLEFLTQWRIYNHSDRYDEARPKLISVYGQKIYMIVEHSCKPYYNQGIAYTFSLHICDGNTGSIIKIIDADSLSTQRLRWPCSVQAINHDTCYILDTMTSGKYFNGQWQKHWSRVLQLGQDEKNLVKELFQLDSEAATMAMTKQTMIIAANGEILFVDLAFIHQHE